MKEKLIEIYNDFIRTYSIIDLISDYSKLADLEESFRLIISERVPDVEVRCWIPADIFHRNLQVILIVKRESDKDLLKDLNLYTKLSHEI